MPVLANLRWERFANNIAGGMTQVEAHKSAGFNAKHVDSAASKLAAKPQVAARIEELKRRITSKAVTEAALTKELILRTLWENVQEARSVKGGSAVVNRGCELIGKELGMFRDPVDKPILNLEDLPPETLQRMLEQAEAAAAQDGDSPSPPKVVN